MSGGSSQRPGNGKPIRMGDGSNLQSNLGRTPSVTLFGFDIVLADSIAKHFPSDPQESRCFFLVPIGFF